jgi:hypothetical protein
LFWQHSFDSRACVPPCLRTLASCVPVCLAARSRHGRPAGHERVGASICTAGRGGGRHDPRRKAVWSSPIDDLQLLYAWRDATGRTDDGRQRQPVCAAWPPRGTPTCPLPPSVRSLLYVHVRTGGPCFVDPLVRLVACRSDSCVPSPLDALCSTISSQRDIHGRCGSLDSYVVHAFPATQSCPMEILFFF